MVTRLSDEERRRYALEGYVTPRWRLPASVHQRMRAALEALIVENAGVRPEHLVLRWGGAENALPTHQKFLHFARHPAMLDLVEDLLGPDIICWGGHVICKPPGDGLEVPWHQDSQYWPIRPLVTCTVWVALDAATLENGCLRVIPGSHRPRVDFHHRVDASPTLAIEQVIDDERLTESNAIDIVLEPGQLSMHDAYLVHSSRANRSSARRAGLALRYMPATSRYDRSIKMPGGGAAIRQDMSRRPIYLVRGQDRAGNDLEAGQERPFEVGA